jgi:hypothetical protein
VCRSGFPELFEKSDFAFEHIFEPIFEHIVDPSFVHIFEPSFEHIFGTTFEDIVERSFEDVRRRRRPIVQRPQPVPGVGEPSERVRKRLSEKSSNSEKRFEKSQVGQESGRRIYKEVIAAWQPK